MSRPSKILVLSSGLVGALCALPVVYLFIRAGLAETSLLEFLRTPRAWLTLWRSTLLAAAVGSAALFIGVIFAWLTVRTDLPARRFWSVAGVLPLVFPSYIGAYTLISAIGPKGLVQQWLEPLGVERLPDIYGFGGAWLALTLFSYPYVLLTVRGGLRGLDPALEDASRNLGRRSGQVFREIILPQLRPSILAGTLLVVLYTLSDFGAVSMLQFESFTRVIYTQYESSFDRSAAAFPALLLMLLTLVVLYGELHLRKQHKLYRAHAASMRLSRTIELGGWKMPALLFCGLVVLVGLVLPLTVILYWLVAGIRAGETELWPIAQLWNSTFASLLAGLLAVVLSLPVARLAVRHPGWFARWSERAAYLSHALPGIVIALSLVFFSVRIPPIELGSVTIDLYQSYAVLIFAYALHFLPMALGSIRSSMGQLNPRVEEAATMLGADRGRVFRSVTLPLLRPGVLTGLALVFLTCMKELPATLLLGPTGFDTLATRIWSATEEAFFARAAGPALILIVFTACSVAIILSQEEKHVY